MLKDIRNEYQKSVLDDAQLTDEPLAFFQRWLNEAISVGVLEPTAMVLATVRDDAPDTRIVLLKEIGSEGFIFYTNYLSQKGRQIEKNRQVALNFFWPELERQIRIRGTAVQIDQKKSANYFESRPRDSQLGAWASMQSKEIANRDELEKQFDNAKKRFENQPIPKPDHWGGYLVKPDEIEFWQGRPNRLHDRIMYQKSKEKWLIKRLQP